MVAIQRQNHYIHVIMFYNSHISAIHTHGLCSIDLPSRAQSLLRVLLLR